MEQNKNYMKIESDTKRIDDPEDSVIEGEEIEKDDYSRRTKMQRQIIQWKEETMRKK